MQKNESKYLLSIENIEAGYGKVKVLHDISIKVKPGDIVTMVGANGVGKSTTLKSILNLVQLQKGSITFKNENISQLPPYEIVSRGIGYSPEGREVFGNLSVYENLRIGAYTIARNKFDERLETVYNLFPRLAERSKQESSSLSGGEQQMLAIGRALMQDPALLLLDEPSLGLAPIIAENIFEKLEEINASTGTTILLVEQNVNLALQLSNYAYVMEKGKIALEGNADKLMNDDYVKNTYLGIA